jgi:FlaA1/EpsC-like NDP-sugar epimerase
MSRLPGRSLVVVLLDAAFILAAVVTAAYMRFGDFAWADDNGVAKVLLVAAVMQASLYLCDLYNAQLESNKGELFIRVLKGLGGASIVLAVLYFMFPSLPIGRGVAWRAAALAVPVVIGWRLLLDFFARKADVQVRA